MKRNRVLISAVLAGAAVSGPPARGAPPLPISPSVLRDVERSARGEGPASVSGKNEQEKIAQLKEKALGSDAQASLVAIQELKGMGAVARPTTVAVLRQVLTKDQAAVEQAVGGIGDLSAAAEYEKQIDALRKEARENVPKLDKAVPETIKRARAYYDQLVPMTEKMNQAWGLRLAVIEAMGRRTPLVNMWRDVAPAGDKQFTTDSETKLREKARKAVGDFVEKTEGLEWGKAPTDPALRPIWFYGMSRKIDAYNESVAAKIMDAEEINNLKFVNKYREAIGLLPLEADPRLVQAARRHSKAMVDRNFFAHESPVAGNASPSDRMKNAGYPGGGGENIAYGPSSGEETFWMWFGSPGHHKNMAGEGYTQLGVGRWQNRFTQNLGGAKRVMLMTDEEKSKLKVDGEVLAPDGGAGSTGTPMTTGSGGRKRG
ncbi:MAG TPA: CAP domain-containing protein [Tepidisphaeraceae bacterium]|nr:CAP domain-containing protein [Tepidisphaeraceae bacterium]